MLRVFVVVAVAVGSANGQSPGTKDGPGTVSAEATEVIVARPDQAKVYFLLTAKAGDARDAEAEDSGRLKDLTQALTDLKVPGLRIDPQDARLTRIESESRFGGGGGPVPPPPVVDFRINRRVIVTIPAEGAELIKQVDRVQKEAAKLGVAGDSGGVQYNGWSNERVAPVRVSYGLKAGWEKLEPAALTKATRAAKVRAEALADGLGMSLADLVSVGEPQNLAPQSTNIYNYGAASEAGTSEEFSDGELRRKVRVRVVFTLKKR